MSLFISNFALKGERQTRPRPRLGMEAGMAFEEKPSAIQSCPFGTSLVPHSLGQYPFDIHVKESPHPEPCTDKEELDVLCLERLVLAGHSPSQRAPRRYTGLGTFDNKAAVCSAHRATWMGTTKLSRKECQSACF